MTDWTQGAAWMDGEIIPIGEAKIGVTDWGLTHSLVFVRCYPGRH